MATTHTRPTKGKRLLQSPALKPKSIKLEQFPDIGLCVLVCDCELKDLLEHMLAHVFWRKSDKGLKPTQSNWWTRLTNELQLPRHMKREAQIALSAKLNKTDPGTNQKVKLKHYIRDTLDLTLYELQCALEALGEDKGELVSVEARSLREIRINVVHKNYKFENEDKDEKSTFLKSYDRFITEFDFKTYCGSSDVEAKREEYREPLSKHEKLMKVLSEYNDIHKTLEKERAESKKLYNQLKREYETLVGARDRLKETMDEQLMGEITERSRLEVDLVEKQQQLSDKDKEIDSARKTLEKERNQRREQDGNRREAHNRLGADYRTLEEHFNRELEAKTLLKQQLSDKDKEIDRLIEEQTEHLTKINERLLQEKKKLKEKDETISKLDQEMKGLKYQAESDSSYIAEMQEENDELKEQVETLNEKVETLHGKVETLEEQLTGCRYYTNRADAQVQTGEQVDRRHTF